MGIFCKFLYFYIFSNSIIIFVSHFNANEISKCFMQHICIHTVLVFPRKCLFSVSSIMVTITLVTTSVFAEFKEHVYKHTYATVKLTSRNELKIQWSLKNWVEKIDPEKLAKHWTMNENNENESWEMFKRANKLFKNSAALLSENDETFSLIFLCTETYLLIR